MLIALQRWLPSGYQGVRTPFDMGALHSGRFAEVFDATWRNDKRLAGRPDVMRLRTYFAYMLASWCPPGEFLAIGVSFAVVPKVLNDLLHPLRYHLVDPFTDPDGLGCNTDPEFVRRLMPNALIHLTPIPQGIPLRMRLAFAHLNSGDIEAERAVLPYLYSRLKPGGAILIDYYASHHHRAKFDRLGLPIFTLPSGQGVLRRRAV